MENDGGTAQAYVNINRATVLNFTEHKCDVAAFRRTAPPNCVDVTGSLVAPWSEEKRKDDESSAPTRRQRRQRAVMKGSY